MITIFTNASILHSPPDHRDLHSFPTRRSSDLVRAAIAAGINVNITLIFSLASHAKVIDAFLSGLEDRVRAGKPVERIASVARSEEHTSELQSQFHLVCRLLLEKKKDMSSAWLL